MSNDWNGMNYVIETIGRKDAEFTRALPGEAAFAESYRQRLAALDPAAPDEDEFSLVFPAFLAVLCAARPDLPIQSLTPLAIHRAMNCASINVEEADLREPSEEVVHGAIALRVAAEVVDEIYDTIVDGIAPDPADSIRNRTARWREMAAQRLATTPNDGDEVSLPQLVQQAVEDTFLIAAVENQTDRTERLLMLCEAGTLAAEGNPRSNPEKAIIEAVVVDAATAGLDGELTAAIMREAIDVAFDGDYASFGQIRRLPAAGLMGNEPQAINIATSLATCIATVLHVGGVLMMDDAPAAHLGGAIASDLVAEAREIPNGVDKAALVAGIAVDMVRDAADTWNGHLGTAQDAGKDIASILAGASPETADYLLTTGAMIAHPSASQEVEFAHAFVAHQGISEAGARRLARAVNQFSDNMTSKNVPAGTFWSGTKAIARTWRDVTTLAKTLSTAAGVRYAVLPITVGRAPLMLIHDGRKATLLDVSVTTTDDPSSIMN